MKKFLIIATISCIALLNQGSSTGAENFNALLKKIEKSQHASFSFVSKVKISSFQKKNHKSSITMEVFGLGLDKSIARYLVPQVDRGKAVLMVGKNYWLYFPKIRQAIKISPRQSLLGQAFIGDIVKPPLLKTYKGKLLQKMKKGGDTLYVVELTAKASNAAYQKIILHFSSRLQTTVYEEFFTRSGVMLKKAIYSKPKRISGNMFNRQIRIENAVNKNIYTTVTFLDVKVKKLNPNIFKIPAIPYIPYEY